MPEIEIIAATKTLQQQPLSSIARKSRVAAYARVSTGAGRAAIQL